MIALLRASGRARAAAAAVFALALPALASALDPAGTVPAQYFSSEKLSAAMETVNDSTGALVDSVETDDRRSFGIRAYASWRDFAVALACDGFTFRGAETAPGSRADELTAAAAWMGPPLGGGPFSVRLGAGAGLRAWGDFGFIALQRLWHVALGVSRPFPVDFNASTLRPFAYASADASLRVAGSFAAEAAVRELALGSGALESSVALLAAQRDGLSDNWIGLSLQGRLGRFDLNDELANEYEEGPWLLLGARTGLLAIENSLNLRVNFAIQSIALRFGGPRREGEAGRFLQELAVGTSFLQSELSATRFIVLGVGAGELRVGIGTVEGVSRQLWSDEGYPHFQEASAALEIMAPVNGRLAALRPFAGIAFGARQDSLSVSDLYRSSLVRSSSGLIGKAYVGLRALEAELPPAWGGKIGVDLGAGVSSVGAAYPPTEAMLFLRACVGE